MNSIDIVQQRIINQQLAGTEFKSAKEIVRWMGAMQAQDYTMAKWAIGVRLPNSTDETVEKAINAGEIIRTHVMRPTWHLVSSDDVKWMLALTAPHLRKSMKGRHKALKLTDQIFKKSNSIIEKSLIKNRFMTRGDLVAELNKNKIKPDSLQSLHIMFNAELNGTVCNGPMRGKQYTYALLDERVPRSNTLKKEEALVELSKRYFTSHGPATIQDFAWWSGLPAADVKITLELLNSNFQSERIEGQVYWFSNSSIVDATQMPIHFLPAFDEFMISYKDRSALLAPKYTSQAITNNGIFRPIVVVNSQVVGTWSREIKNKKIIVEPKFFRSLQKLNKIEMNTALEPYKKFLGKK